MHRFVFVSLSFFATDPAPVLEASHSLEERLQKLQSSAPGSEALVREISGHWKKHLEKGQPTIILISLTLSEGSYWVIRVIVCPPTGSTEDVSTDSTPPASRMTPNSTPAPEAPASPQQNHRNQTEDKR